MFSSVFPAVFPRRPARCGRLEGQDQLRELDLQRERVAILRRLYQEDHQERDDGCARIDYELPCVAEVE